MTQLAAQTALVTGANRGLGREFVDQLLARGVTKVYAGARSPETSDLDDPRVVPLKLDGIEAGALEVMADDITRAVGGGLAQPVDERYAALLPNAV